MSDRKGSGTYRACTGMIGERLPVSGARWSPLAASWQIELVFEHDFRDIPSVNVLAGDEDMRTSVDPVTRLRGPRIVAAKANRAGITPGVRRRNSQQAIVFVPILKGVSETAFRGWPVHIPWPEKDQSIQAMKEVLVRSR